MRPVGGHKLAFQLLALFRTHGLMTGTKVFRQLEESTPAGRVGRFMVVLAAVVFALPVAGELRDGTSDFKVPKVSLAEVMDGRVSAAFVPEYDRHLDRVLLSVHSVADRAWLETNLRALSLLPVYSSVLMLVPDRMDVTESARFEMLAEARGGASRIETSPLPEAWAQDIGEGTGDGFMLGYKGSIVAGSVARLGIRAFRHFLPLDGGNIHLARNRDQRRFLIIGSEEYELGWQMVTEQFGVVVTNARAMAKEVYRRTFDADEVLVLPNLDNAHIDQMVLCLGDGVVATEVLPEPDDHDRRLLVNFLVEWANAARTGMTTRVELYPAEYRGDSRRVAFNRQDGRAREVPLTRFMNTEQKEIFLRYRARCPQLHDLVYADAYRRNRRAIERRLAENGFEIVHLKTSVWHKHNCQTFVNAMPFRNRDTGRAGVLLPVYLNPGAVEEAIVLDDLRGLNRENVETLRALGYEVIPVPSHVQLGGNLHCSILQF